MNIAYFAPGTYHDAKWINHFAKYNNVYLISPLNISQEFKSHFSSNVKIVPFFEPVKVLNKFQNRSNIFKLKKLIKSLKIDIIHALYAIPYAIWAYEVNTVPYVISCRGSDINKDIKSFKKNSLNPIKHLKNLLLDKKSKLAFNCAHTITGTSFNLIKSIKNICSNNKVLLIRTGINLEYLDELYNNAAICNNTLNILSPRSILNGFNIEIILYSFNKLIKIYPDKEIKLHIIDGFDNSISKSLKEYVKSNRLEQKVTFYPFLNYKDLIALYEKIEIVVMIPNTDGTPNSGIESMYLKKILIVGNSNYDNNIFNNNTCWQIKKNSTEDLFNEFTRILDSSNIDIAKKLSFAKETIISQANIKDQLKKVDMVYNEIINNE